MRGIVNDVVERLLDSSTAVSSTDVALAAGISRQAAHKHLRLKVESGELVVAGKARAARYSRPKAPEKAAVSIPAMLRTKLEVASAGSQYRLSARLLLDGVTSGEVVLDFTGVVDLGEEFLDEVFLVWAPAHPKVNLKLAHFPSRHAGLLMKLAKSQRAQQVLKPSAARAV
jgi:hypothetical protein